MIKFIFRAPMIYFSLVSVKSILWYFPFSIQNESSLVQVRNTNNLPDIIVVVNRWHFF
jgi:hypothetical protein